MIVTGPFLLAVKEPGYVHGTKAMVLKMTDRQYIAGGVHVP